VAHETGHIHILLQNPPFIWTEPRLPDPQTKTFLRYPTPLGLEPGMERHDIIARLESIRTENELADLAFYAYRDLNRVEAEPYLKAALERCPVAIEAAAAARLNDDALVAKVKAMPDESIYDEDGRLAQPDEVWNYGRGDGVEKAVLLANVLRSRHRGQAIRVKVMPNEATLEAPGTTITFPSRKGLREQIWDCGGWPEP
jgi:hypothetical protein